MNEYRNVSPKDTSSQAVASERAGARAAGWEVVMGRAVAVLTVKASVGK